MESPFDPVVSKEISTVVTAFQGTGTLLIALLLRLLNRGIPGRFLHYWSLGWAALAAALVSLSGTFLVLPHLSPETADWVRPPALAVYCVLEYVFAFFLWAGFRAYAADTPLRPADGWLLAPGAAFGLVAPAFLPEINLLFPFHAAVFGGFCLLALAATRGVRPATRQTAVGLRLAQFAMTALVLVFWHYAVVMGFLLILLRPPDLYYLHYSALFDAGVEAVLAFGMVVLGADSIRRELESRNRELAAANLRLAEASEQLTAVARTDALTGLLNRRAFDELLDDRGRESFAGAVGAIDLNHLKWLNDEYGHHAGDAAIRIVARELRHQFRPADPVFRMGGDEFLVVLDGGGEGTLAERLVAVDRALRGRRVTDVPGTVDLVIAWGTAEFGAASAFGAAVARADQAMYACKAARKAYANSAAPAGRPAGGSVAGLIR